MIIWIPPHINTYNTGEQRYVACRIIGVEIHRENIPFISSRKNFSWSVKYSKYYNIVETRGLSVGTL